MTDVSRKIYWVVAYFPKSNEYCVLPMTWLLQKTSMNGSGMYCLWPSYSITNEIIVRADPPGPSWLPFRIKIIVNKLFDDFVRAWHQLVILIESSVEETSLITDQDICGKESNSLKPINDSMLNDPSSLSQLLEVPMSVDLPTDEMTAGQESITMNYPMLTDLQIKNLDHINDLDIKYLLYGIYNGGVNIKFMLSEVLSKLEDLKKSFAQIELPLTNNINAQFYKMFPINNSVELKHIEECILRNEFGFGYKLENYIKIIGGSSFKNHVVRALPRFISDKFAIQCTWTGRRKGTLTKICDTTLITVIKRVLQENYAPEINTDFEFEKIVAGWFRLSVSRYNKSKLKSAKPW